MLTVDVDEVKVAYPSIWELMEDLRDMGESNAVLGRLVGDIVRFLMVIDNIRRRNYVHRDTLAAASAIYKGIP